MPVEDRRRAAPRRAAAASFGEEAADTLMELVTPAGQDPATRADMRGLLAALEGLDERLGVQRVAMDQRWEQRAEAMEHRLTACFERGLREAITAQTRAFPVSVVAIAGLGFGLTS